MRGELLVWTIIFSLSIGCTHPAGKPISRRAASDRIQAFCIDFNWGEGGPNGFAPPGVYTQADPQEHLNWYKALGVNTIQTFCVSCCGYSWYRGDIAPVQPGMKGDFLKEITELGHREGMKVMGYFCVGANTFWGQTHPELSLGYPSSIHIPFTNEYLDYLCATIHDVLIKTDIDGFMIDWVFSPPAPGHGDRVKWIDCERQMYQELFGVPFPGIEAITPEHEIEFLRRSTERCWSRIHDAAKSTKPSAIIWLSCYDLNSPQVTGSKMFKEIDWLMNEHPDPSYLEAARKAVGPQTRIIQCVCGWGPQHDPMKVVNDPVYADVGLYGFAMPDAKTTLPPLESDNLSLAGNAKNIELMRRIFHPQSMSLR